MHQKNKRYKTLIEAFEDAAKADTGIEILFNKQNEVYLQDVIEIEKQVYERIKQQYIKQHPLPDDSNFVECYRIRAGVS